MPVVMNKELLIRMPSSLYEKTVRLCRKRYMSISSFIRELIIEQIESSLTAHEEKIVAAGERQYLKGKGVNWRKIRRG
jgi:predicted DNA-binding protein